MTPAELSKLRNLAKLRRQFERALAEAMPHHFEKYEQGNFLLVRFHKCVAVPQVFWQVAGEHAKNVQKQLHDLISTIPPDTLEKYAQGYELEIRIPQVGLGHVTWVTKKPRQAWVPGGAEEMDNNA